jgi:hypothetical protein
MNGVKFLETFGEPGHRITVGLDEALGRFTVATVHGSTYAAETGSRPREYAYFDFPELTELEAGIDMDGEGSDDNTPEWQDHMHDSPDANILPRLRRVINEARRQGSLVPALEVYLKSELAASALKRISKAQ